VAKKRAALAADAQLTGGIAGNQQGGCTANLHPLTRFSVPGINPWHALILELNKKYWRKYDQAHEGAIGGRSTQLIPHDRAAIE
jgi:hypothetical protein